MNHLTDMFSYRIFAPKNVRTDFIRYGDSIEAIETQYPDDVNSILWRDIMTHKFVQSLKEFEEFHGFLDQKVLMESQWLDYNIIQNMLVRLYVTK